MPKRVWVLFILILTLQGCAQRDLNIKIKFEHINGLEQGDRVVFEKNHIGHVSSIFHTKDGNFLVGISIKENFANAATEHSRFAIVRDPENRGDKAIEMTRIKSGGALLKDGQVVEGVTNTPAFFERAREELERSVNELKRQFESFSEELKKIPENKEFRELKEELEALPEKVKKAGEDAREKIEKEVLPRLKRDMEQLKRKFLEQEKQDDKGLIRT